MEIRTFGGGARLRECEKILADAKADKFKQVVLLPIPTTRDNKYITGSSTPISAVLALAQAQTLIAGYNIPSNIATEAARLGAAVYDAGRDEDFLKRNAAVTARGAIGRLLSDSSTDISDLRIGIIGYGRIGRELVRLCLFLGAHTRVYTTRESVAEDLVSIGVDAEVVHSDSDLSALDIIFNTSPEAIVDAERIRALPQSTRIIDLASGNVFAPSERLTKLSSIPDAMYPKTAGKIYCEAILEAIGRGGGL